jgi:hypothetical protein
LCDLDFTFYKQIYKCHARYGLLDTKDWEEWNPSMKHFFGKPYVCGYWAVTRERYAASFQKYANKLVATSQQSEPSGEGD